jgi:hypothetical protein
VSPRGLGERAISLKKANRCLSKKRYRISRHPERSVNIQPERMNPKKINIRISNVKRRTIKKTTKALYRLIEAPFYGLANPLR